MCFSGLDATGGAGVQADIESLFSNGCHCLPVITANTVQSTRNAMAVIPVSAEFLEQQARAVLEDIPVHCFKIGLTAGISCVEVLHALIRDYPQIPVVLDPVIHAGGGFPFNQNDTVNAIRELLVPFTKVITPNTVELLQLVPGTPSLDECASSLLDLGCKNVLLTGTHEATPQVTNRLYTEDRQTILYNWPRLPHEYHGSGCTLAAALASGIAHQLDLREAVQRAQRYTWEALSHGSRVGFGQLLPERGAGTLVLN